MTPEEIVDLLTLAAGFDRRTVGKADVNAWFLAVNDLPFDDAQAAVVAHYRETSEWLMPAHVRRRVKAIREARIATIPMIDAPSRELTEAEYRRALKEITRRAGDGRTPIRAVPAGRPSGPPAEFKQARSAADNDRVLAQTVACPVDWCNARAGEPCRSSPEGPPLTNFHPSRLDAAMGGTAAGEAGDVS